MSAAWWGRRENGRSCQMLKSPEYSRVAGRLLSKPTERAAAVFPPELVSDQYPLDFIYWIDAIQTNESRLQHFLLGFRSNNRIWLRHAQDVVAHRALAEVERHRL